MTPEQQHESRNGLIAIWVRIRWVEKNLSLSSAGVDQLTGMKSDCCRIAAALGMSVGAKDADLSK